jgi:hypothetical protein
MAYFDPDSEVDVEMDPHSATVSSDARCPGGENLENKSIKNGPAY